MQLSFAFIAIALVASVSSTPMAAAGVGPVCLPPTYGCGTPLRPKCCDPYTKREIDARTGDFRCPPDTCGCGTRLHPKCCDLPPVGAACGIELPPCCSCVDGKVVCEV